MAKVEGDSSGLNEPIAVYRNPHAEYHADFADVTVAPNGHIVALVRRCGSWGHDATFKFGRPLTLFEAQPEFVVLRSVDGGCTFQEESVLHTGLAYDPVLCTLMDGRLLAGMVVGDAGPSRGRAKLPGVFHRHIPELETAITLHGIGLWISSDYGRTWPDGPTLASPAGWENVYNLRKPVQLVDETLLLPAALGYPARSRFVGLLRSWDRGHSFTDPSVIAEDPAGRAFYAAGMGYWQPAIALDGCGGLICVCVQDDRTSAPPSPTTRPGVGYGFSRGDALSPLCRIHSRDAGFTWSLPAPMDIKGDFPSLVLLPDNKLLLTCVEIRPDSAAVVAYVSEDGGAAWSRAAVVREAQGHAFYYANTVVLLDGSLVTVYTAAEPTQVRHVEAVYWRL